MHKAASSLIICSVVLAGCEGQPKPQAVCEFEVKSAGDGTGLSKDDTARIIEATRKRKGLSLKVEFSSDTDVSYNAEYYFKPLALTVQNQQVIAESPVLKKLPGQKEWEVKSTLVGTEILIVSTDGTMQKILSQPDPNVISDIKSSELRLPVTWCVLN